MSARPFITCRELIEFIGAYFEGGLTASQSNDFDFHLARCASCRAYLVTYRTAMAAGKAAMHYDDANDDAPEDLIRAILAIRR